MAITHRTPQRQQQRRVDALRPTGLPRHIFRSVLLFIASVLIANALIGERGLIATHTARRNFEHLANEIHFLHSENSRLRTVANRLRSDLGAIEAVARNEFGLLSPGELLFLLNDKRSAPDDRQVPTTRVDH